MQETDIDNLIQRWTDGSLTAAERSQLAELLEDLNHKDMVINILQRHMMEGNATAAFDEIRFLPLLREVLGADRWIEEINKNAEALNEDEGQNEIVVRPVRRMWMGWRVAAAVLMLALGTALVMMIRRKGTVRDVAEQRISVNDALPGSDKAILTLADGTKVILDSAHNGILAEQGGTKIVKPENGRVRYDAGAHGEVTENLLVTPRGGKYQVTLPDGTQVWLNAASSMRYPTAFTGRERIVTITGEVYFEVAKETGKAFIVKVNDLSVEVLGTHFNVNAYTDEVMVRTSLLEGAVRVKDGAGQMVTLKPGQEAQTPGDRQAMRVVSGIDTAQVMAWKNGLFQFRNTDLASVMRQLARWYDLDVVYEGKIPTDRFDGKIPRDATAAQVLAILQKNQIHFKIEGKKLMVLP